MVKVKLTSNNCRRLYEERLSANTINKQITIDADKTINDLWNELIKEKRKSVKKLFKGSSLQNIEIPLSKMNYPIKVKIKNKTTGAITEDEIIPAEIASFCDLVKSYAMKNNILSTILARFPKPIIWTFAVSTACTDGIRIAFNPIFANELIHLGNNDLKNDIKLDKSPNNSAEKYITIGKYFLFVLVHEAYHQIYRHHEQAERKAETIGGKNHDLCNISMDVEINRDIEKQIKSIFAGTTEKSGGMFDNSFKSEPWQVIFDAYFSHKKEPPTSEGYPINDMQPTSNSQDTEDDEQNGQTGNNNQSQDNQQGNSQGSQDKQTNNNQSSEDNQQGNNQGSQGQNNDSNDNIDKPDLNEKSDIYKKTYEEELKKELDKMRNKNRSNSNNTEESEDNDQNSGNSNSQDNPNNDPNGDPNDSNSTDDSDGMDGTEGYPGEPMSGDSNNSNSTEGEPIPGGPNGQMSDNVSPEDKAIIEQAKKQAREDIKKLNEQIKDEIEDQMNNQLNPGIDAGKGGNSDKIYNTETSDVFGGADMLSREQMAKLAAETGSPYNAEELTKNIDELNREFNEKYDDKLRNISPDLANKLNDITDKLKVLQSLGNWRVLLKKHFTAAMKSDTENVRSKRVLSQTWREDRANPYKEREVINNNKAANLFYLIDNSGSMYINGNSIFYQIFKEIVTMEQRCKVLNSARAYFTTDIILPHMVEMWNIKTPVIKRLELLGERGGSGGTDISKNVISVTRLKKPYYYNNGDRHTTILVFTDGEDNGWKRLQEIPRKILKDIVFVFFNPDINYILKTFKEINMYGIPWSNLIGIDTSNYKPLHN